MSEEKYPEYTDWVEHVYSALRWAEGSIRKLHEILETETVTDDLRQRTLTAISWIESARKQAFFAFEKMGTTCRSADPKFDVSSIGDETKIGVLRLNASFLEKTIGAVEEKSFEALKGLMTAAIRAMREEANGIEAKVKRELDGPSR